MLYNGENIVIDISRKATIIKNVVRIGTLVEMIFILYWST